MPTDLAAVLVRKSEARAQTQNDISLLSICLIIALTFLVLLFAFDSFADATALVGLY